MFLNQNHTDLPFKLVRLKPDENEDEATLAHRHNYFELFVFADEGKEHLIDFDKYPVKKNSLHLVIPGCVHLLRRNAKTNGFVILFSEAFYQLNLVKNNLWHNLIPALLKNGAAINLNEENFSIILDLCRHISMAKDNDIIRSYLQLIIQQMMVSFDHQALNLDSKMKSMAYDFRKLVENHFYEEHRLSFYANRLGINATSLSSKVKATFGASAAEIIQERLLLEAKRMLFHDNYSSKEIAYHLGYNDDSYFSRFFKNKTSFSPNQFRKNCRSQYNQ